MKYLIIGSITLLFGSIFFDLGPITRDLDAGNTKSPSIQRLVIDESGHFLTTEDGRPFFWLGDTGWQLFSKLDREEVIRYFKDRKDKKFNVIQAHVLDWDIRKPNAYGHLAFIEGDIDRPNEGYWQHVDFILKKAGKMGLYIALLPAWGGSHIENKRKSPGSLELNPAMAYRYGKFIGNRFQKHINIIWILGGDVNPTKHDVYDSLAKGITEGYGKGDPKNLLMSYHPPGGTYRPPATSTGEFYHERPWMDFNMIQSGHSIGNKNYERISEDYQRTPVKPTIDSEPCYEQHPVKHKFKNGVFTSWHLRRRAYWSILAGGFGFTYGGNGIWQMDKPGNVQKESHHNNFWYDAIDYKGASDMTHVRNIFESRPFIGPYRIPDQGIIMSDKGTVDDRIQAVTASDKSYHIIYITNGRSFEMDLSQMSGKRLICWWYNPRDGKIYDNKFRASTRPFISFSDKKTYRFDPPGEMENDWILVIDDASAKYPTPGNLK